MNNYAPKQRAVADIELELDMLLVNCTAKRLRDMTELELERIYRRIPAKSIEYKLNIARQRRAGELAAL